jgi:hypothetical protein
MVYRSLDPAQARKICVDDTLAGLQNIVKSSTNKPFRFLYMSGADAETDQTKTPPVMPEYFLMRVGSSLNINWTATNLDTGRS